ncbi:uncharacterized protein LOC106866201 isoform X2 [Brachypodium distachyon]|uniref:uncharacterized protein LOC106866201 isoform X2 n=1 Tax=Brachypodium distachyon TaxID=15368 RepID=UPI00071E340E|nr:uncharacterized protein LOC106866201 isoform X2 [Brachypodium distachyon]|eukprot:XP_014754548.1 uncharacterized protein LOC106866201 isoform X2 [Brachypodium distachyon]
MRLLAAVPSASLPLDHYALFAARRSPATMSSPSSVIDSAASSSTILRPPHCPDGPFSGQCAAPTSTRFSVQRPDSCAATPQCSGLTLRKLHHPDPPTCTDHLPLPSNRFWCQIHVNGVANAVLKAEESKDAKRKGGTPLVCSSIWCNVRR